MLIYTLSPILSLPFLSSAPHRLSTCKTLPAFVNFMAPSRTRSVGLSCARITKRSAFVLIRAYCTFPFSSKRIPNTCYRKLHCQESKRDSNRKKERRLKYRCIERKQFCQYGHTLLKLIIAIGRFGKIIN